MAASNMGNLKSTIEDLATEFAMSIISALRSASIDELTNVSTGGSRPASRGPGRPPASESASSGGGRKRGRGGRLGRRTTADIGKMVEHVVSLLQKNPSGLRAEQIRSALGVQAKELPRPLADGLAEGRITKTGQKRATTYFAGGAKKAVGRGKKR